MTNHRDTMFPSHGEKHITRLYSLPEATGGALTNLVTVSCGNSSTYSVGAITRSGSTESLIPTFIAGTMSIADKPKLAAAVAAEASMHPKIYLDLYNLFVSAIRTRSISLPQPAQTGAIQRVCLTAQQVKVLTSNTS